MNRITIFDKDNWIEIFHSLGKNKLRTFFTAFGVFWGIFMLVMMLGSGKGLNNGVNAGWGDMATNSIFIWGERTNLPYKGFDRGRFISFDNGDTQALIANIPEIQYLAPRQRVGGQRGVNNVVRNEKTSTNSILGDYPELNLIDPSIIVDGRYINDYDIQLERKVAVLGIRAKDELFDSDEDAIGQSIQINGVNFVVIGLKKSKKQNQQAENDNSEIVIPFTSMQKTYNMGNKVGWYSFTAKPEYKASEVLGKIKNLLRQRHSISPDDPGGIGYFDLGNEFEKMNNLFFGIDTLIWIVGLGTLFAGIVGVSNIMLIVVKERTKEIGIKRAIGASPNDIRLQIITESVFLTTIAGYIGLSAGVMLLEFINYTMIKYGAQSDMFLNPEVDFKKAIMALVILVFSGAIAGIIPAQRAVKLKPIEALRDE